MTLHRGEVLTVGYVPGHGTTLVAPSGASAVVEGAEFGHAILRTWLGEHPSDRELERKLLGGDDPASAPEPPETQG